MKVFQIYSGKPKRWGMTIGHQICVLLSLVPPLWLEKLWLLLVFIPLGWVVGKTISNEDAYLLSKIKSWFHPNYIVGNYFRHTFSNKLK